MKYLKHFNEEFSFLRSTFHKRYLPDDVYTIKLWRWLEEEVSDEISIDVLYNDSKYNFVYKFPIKYISISFDMIEGKRYLDIKFCKNDIESLMLRYKMDRHNLIDKECRLLMNNINDFDRSSKEDGYVYFMGWSCGELERLKDDIYYFIDNGDSLDKWMVDI